MTAQDKLSEYIFLLFSPITRNCVIWRLITITRLWRYQLPSIDNLYYLYVHVLFLHSHIKVPITGHLTEIYFHNRKQPIEIQCRALNLSKKTISHIKRAQQVGDQNKYIVRLYYTISILLRTTFEYISPLRKSSL